MYFGVFGYIIWLLVRCATIRAEWVFHSAESAIFVSDNVALFRKAMIRYLYGISG